LYDPDATKEECRMEISEPIFPDAGVATRAIRFTSGPAGTISDPPSEHPPKRRALERIQHDLRVHILKLTFLLKMPFRLTAALKSESAEPPGYQ
jgi:hypothetical protein